MTKNRLFTSVFFLGAIAFAASIVSAADNSKSSSDKQAELIAVLRSDAQPGDKAIACKKLAIYGSSEAVPELAKLLANEELASWGRIALEAIPGPAADEALRKSLDSLKGKLLVGAINSIGVRKDAAAVEALTTLLTGQDADAASAAAVALGHIGNDAAVKSLRPQLAAADAKVRSAVAEGCVLCAERLQAAGRSADAAELYDAVRRAQVPKQRILEATRGAILSRKDEGIALLLEQFRSSDKAMFQLALGTAREFPGDKIDQALAAELGRAAPERAALLLTAMTDRPATVVLPAVLQAAGSGPKPVRLAAINALGRVGDASCVAPLTQMAIDADADLAAAAKTALAELPGEKADAEIVARLAKAEGPAYPVLIAVVGQRRIDATPELLKAAGNSDAAVRRAALTALGETVGLANLSVLIEQAVSPKSADDAEVAQKALRAACVRMPQREECAEQVSKAVERSPVETKIVLLQILGAMGGGKALQTVGLAAKSSEPQLQDTGTRLLGEWMTVDAAPVLLDLAKADPAQNKYQGRALRGYLRLARQFVMPENQRAEICRNALAICRQPAEQKLVLDVLKRHPTIEALKIAVQIGQTPELKTEATAVSMAIAQKLAGKEADVRQVLAQAGLDKVKLEIVKAEYGAGATQKDVTEVLRKHAGELTLITLPADGYNASFGGDPLPGTPKQLKVQYRINGKPGEAQFAENAVILLPMPK